MFVGFPTQSIHPWSFYTLIFKPATLQFLHPFLCRRHYSVSYSSRVSIPPGSVLDENKSGFPAFSGIARLTWLIDLFGDLTVTSATREKQKDKNYSRMTVHFQTANKKWVMPVATREPSSSSSAGLLCAGVLHPLLLLWNQNGWRLAWKRACLLKMHFIILSLISLLLCGDNILPIK